MSIWLQVLVPKDANLLGRMVDVDIVSTGKHYLMADLVKTGAPHRPESVPPPLQQGQVSGLPEAQVWEHLTTVWHTIDALGAFH